MTTVVALFSLFAQYGPAVFAAIMAAVAAFKASQAHTQASLAAETADRNATSVAQVHLKLNSLLANRPGMPGGDRPL